MVNSIVFAAAAYGGAIVVSAFTAVIMKMLYLVINRNEGDKT